MCVCYIPSAESVLPIDSTSQLATHADDALSIVLRVNGLPVSMTASSHGRRAIGRYARLGSDLHGWHQSPMQPIQASTAFAMRVAANALLLALTAPATTGIELWTVWEPSTSQQDGQRMGSQHDGQHDGKHVTAAQRCGTVPLSLLELHHPEHDLTNSVLPVVLDPHSTEFTSAPPGHVCTLTLVLPASVVHSARVAAGMAIAGDHHVVSHTAAADHVDQQPLSPDSDAAPKPAAAVQAADAPVPPAACMTDMATATEPPPPQTLPVTVNADISIEVDLYSHTLLGPLLDL